MFWSKTFVSGNETIVAICDEELLDKELKQGKLCVKISRGFYGGRLVGETEAGNLMKNSTSGNLFGKKIVALAERLGFITKENIIFIDGIPHTQFIKV